MSADEKIVAAVFMLGTEKTNKILGILTILFTFIYSSNSDWCFLWNEHTTT
jgi:hypothetical protein